MPLDLKTSTTSRLRTLQRWYLRNERLLIPGALLLGFIVDLATFRFINFDLALTLLSGHIILSGGAIAFIDLFEAGRFSHRFFKYLRVFAPLVIQYSFGAMLSASVIFYSFSGSLWASWPFILALVFLMIANEILRKHYINPIVQLTIYFFAIYSIMVLALPYIARDLGWTVFVASGLLSLVVITLYITWLWPKVPQIRESQRGVALGVISVFALMNLFYFTNLIPPFPLALRDIGVFHLVERSGSNYRLLAEERDTFLRWLTPNQINLARIGDRVYVFSSVFAPAKLNLDVVHHWQFFDPETRNWESRGRTSFTIFGGRDQGFRGYSWKSQTEVGRWRVRVETAQGQIIGQVNFRINETGERPELVEVIK